ncbi:MAG: hypothetical protein Q9165_008396 [Trypethelium subeluteriae]
MSMIKDTFRAQIPAWIRHSPEVERDWSAHVQTLEGHRGDVTSITFSLDGMQLVSASDDGNLRRWDASSGRLLQTCEGVRGSWFTSVMFSPNGNQLASGSASNLPASASPHNAVQLWDATTTTLQSYQTLVHLNEHVFSISYSPNGKQLAATLRNSIEIWDVVTGKLLQTLPGKGSWGDSTLFSPDGKNLVATSVGTTLLLWDIVKGEAFQKFEGSQLTFSPSGKQLGSGMVNGIVQMWDVTTGQPMEKFESYHEDMRLEAEFTPDGHVLQYDHCWQDVTDAAFSPNGRQLASSYRGSRASTLG